MAFTEISSQRASSNVPGNSTTRAATYPGNVTAGNLLVVGGSFENHSMKITGSGAGAPAANAWMLLCAELRTGLGNTNGTFLAFAVAPATGACTITGTITTPGNASASGYGNFSITEFTGVGGAVSIAQMLGSSNAPNPGTFSVEAGDLILGALTVRASTTYTVPSGWTKVGENLVYGADATHQFAYLIASAAGSISPTWSIPVSPDWSVSTVVIREFSVGGGGGSADVGGAFAYVA